MTTYEVYYNVQVNTGNSVAALKAFEQAVSPLTQSAQILDRMNQVISKFKSTTRNMQPVTIKVDVGQKTLAKLDLVLNKIQQIKNASRTMLAGGSVSLPKTTTSSPVRRSSGNAIYPAFGATPFMGSNVAAIDFMKGMGVAYGISGLGQLVTGVVKQASEYDNLIQTTRNILKTHDKRSGFDDRFRGMEFVIRNVGVETKFTAPEVADASKFLAMAGLKVEDIKQAIRPIADIALVGDTKLGETADVVTNIMTAYGKPASEMRSMADVMTNTFTMSNTTLLELAEAYKYSATLLSAGKVEFEESAGALGVLGDAGIKGSQAGTTLRTIMANIVNPTKKQREAWDEYGVNLSGKGLLGAFKELANKDLPVEAFYRMFHKTAAQGAVALASSVEKWNNIVAKNYLSQGLTQELADEKKNTIQGLWAQLTSAFTEDGMVAFSGIQSSIKSILKNTVDWLKLDSTQEKFKEFSHTLIEFVGLVKRSVTQIATLFKRFEGAIKTFFKLQLMAWPFISTIKAILGIKNGFMALRSIPGAIPNFMGNFGMMPNYLMAATSPNAYASVGSRVMGSGVSPKKGWYNSIPMFMSDGLVPITRPNMKTVIKNWRTDLWNRTVEQYREDNRDLRRKQLSKTKFQQWEAGMMYRQDYDAIRKLYDPQVQYSKQKLWLKRIGASMPTALTGVGTGLAIAASTDYSPGGILAGGLPAALSLLSFGGKLGWAGAAVAAAFSVAGAIYNQIDAISKANEAMTEYNNTVSTFNGLMTNAESTPLNLALELTFRKNMSINEALEKQVQLYREIHGITDAPANLSDDGANIDKKWYDKWLQDYSEVRASTAFDGYYSAAAQQTLARNDKLFEGFSGNQNPLQVYFSSDGTMYGADYKDSFGRMYPARIRNLAWGDTSTDRLAWIVGAHIAASGEVAKIEKEEAEKWSYLLSNGLDPKLAQAYFEDFDKKYSTLALSDNIDAKYRLDDTTLSFEELKNAPLNKTLPFNNYLNIALNGPDNIAQQRRRLFDQYIAYNDLGGEIPEDFAFKFVEAMNPMVYGQMSKNYVPDDTIATFRNFGYDAERGVISTLDDVNKNTYERITQALKLFPTLPPNLQSAMAEWKDQWEKVITFFQASVYDAREDGDYEILDPSKQSRYSNVSGMNFAYDNVAKVWREGWEPMNPNDKAESHYALSNDLFSRLYHINKNTEGKKGKPGDDYHPTDQSDYKNNYRSSSAAPKQVIVNIGSLMEVKSIDLANKNNEVVIGDLKGKLAQALVDVVHDFSITAGNMV